MIILFFLILLAFMGAILWAVLHQDHHHLFLFLGGLVVFLMLVGMVNSFMK